MPSRAMVPAHIDQILAAILVVEQRRIEAAAVQVHRIGPLAVDRWAGDEIVVSVARGGSARSWLRGASVALHVSKDEPEQAVGVSEARSPNAAGIGIAQHVE